MHEIRDIVNFKKCDGGLRLPVNVKYLPLKFFAQRHIGVTAAEAAIVGNDHELKHMVVKCQRHMVESLHVLVERRDRKNVRVFPKVGR